MFYLEINIFVSLHWARPFTGQFLTLAFRVKAKLLVTQLRCRCTTDPGYMPLSSPSWDSSCSCSEIAVNGKKPQSEHSGLYKLRSVFGCSHMRMTMKIGENLSKDLFLSKLLCFWVVSTCCAHPFPNQVNGPECCGSGVWTESCSLVSRFALLNLRCAKWGRCRNLSVLASPDILDTKSRQG